MNLMNTKNFLIVIQSLLNKNSGILLNAISLQSYENSNKS
jgi:hypothetical protein